MVVRPILRANNGDVLRSAALDGVGVALQPTFLVEEDLSTGAVDKSRVVGVIGKLSSADMEAAAQGLRTVLGC